MQQNWQEYQKYRHKFKELIRFFYLDLIFVIFTFISYSFEIMKPLIIILLGVDILLLFATLIQIMVKLNMVRQLDTVSRRKHYRSSSNKLDDFYRLLEDNLFQYHFQPIVDARTGEIFAYEALMRTDPDTTNLSPTEILDLAEKEGRLYSIERFTFYNTLHLMRENTELFKDKKLFINSISSHPLTDIDFEELYLNYRSLFRNVVMEISETTLLSEDTLRQLQKRLQETGCQLALDDYGTGYSTESNLLHSNPSYIKIDKTMFQYIKVDSRKQHILTSLIHFASQNNIKIIAEGIETREEFEFVINLGVDYIQGFYTSRPSLVLLPRIPQDIITRIKEISGIISREGITERVYETCGDSLLCPATYALNMYTDIIIREHQITLCGSIDRIANLSIQIPDNHSCQITLDHIKLRGNDKPALLLGKNCKVVLILIGDNDILHDSIRVPETSELRITGDGNLSVQAERSNHVGIGGTALQAYGNIILASTGNIRVSSHGNMSVAIGGGQNPYNSSIQLLSGKIDIETSGYNSIGIGSISGNARLEIKHCKINIVTEGSKVVGMGSLRGYVDLSSAGILSIKCSGKYAVAIGSIEDSDGKISIEDGSISIRINTHCGTGIGALGGRVGITIHQGDIAIFGEGMDIIGLGDHSGLGDIYIQNGIIFVQLYAANAIPIGGKGRNIIIDGGNIQCDFPPDIIPVNSYGVPLEARIIMDTNEFFHTVDTVAYSYDYQASFCERYPYIKIYLPENIHFQ